MHVDARTLAAAVGSRAPDRTRQLLRSPRPLLRLPLLQCLAQSLQLESIPRSSALAMRAISSAVGGEGDTGADTELITWFDADAVDILTLRSPTGGIQLLFVIFDPDYV